MSFYASESIKDVIEVRPIDDSTLVALKEPVFQVRFDSFVSNIIKIKKIEQTDYVITIEVNSQLFEKIFFNKDEISEIFIGMSKQSIKSFDFLEAERIKSSYLLKIMISI